MPDKSFYYVADAVTGAPIAKANVEFFAYRQRHIDGNNYQIDTKNFAERTDANGQAFLPLPDDKDGRAARVPMARHRHDAGRPAGLPRLPQRLAQPVPRRTVQRSQNVRHHRPARLSARARRSNSSSGFARPSTTSKTSRRSRTNRSPSKFTIPRAKRSTAKRSRPTTTAASPASSSCRPTPRSASISCMVVNRGGGIVPRRGIQEARVRSHRRSAERAGDARRKNHGHDPREVLLRLARHERHGEVQGAAHRAHGPLVSARPWDWLYGPGYWWFAYDYDWYPGWRDWGCLRPAPWWYCAASRAAGDRRRARSADRRRRHGRQSRSTRRSPRQLHPDQDHRYSIQAEVVDQSRRTIVGNGEVLVARKPFEVFAWVDRGYYRVGDTITASFAARRLDGKPVEGTGKLRLLKITYGAAPERNAGRNRSPLLGPGHRRRRPRRDSDQSLGERPVPPVVSRDRQGRATKSKAATCSRSSAKASTAASSASTTSRSCPTSASTRPTTKSSCRSTPIAPAPRCCCSCGRRTASTCRRRCCGSPARARWSKSASRKRTCRILRRGGHRRRRQACTPRSARSTCRRPSACSMSKSCRRPTRIKPGQHAKVKLKLTDEAGKPFVGSTVLSIFDKSLEYISGGTNVADIKEFFWKWRRAAPAVYRNESRPLVHQPGAARPEGDGKPRRVRRHGRGRCEVATARSDRRRDYRRAGRPREAAMFSSARRRCDAAAPMAAAAEAAAMADCRRLSTSSATPGDAAAGAALVEPTVRSEFADTALWVAVARNQQGRPRRSRARHAGESHGLEDPRLGHGPRHARRRGVGRGRHAQEPHRADAGPAVLRRDATKSCSAPTCTTTCRRPSRCKCGWSSTATRSSCPAPPKSTIEIPAGGEQRVDWRVKVQREGEAVHSHARAAPTKNPTPSR